MIWFFCNLVGKDIIEYEFSLEQIKTGSTVHRTLDHFDFVDKAFNQTIGYWVTDSILDGGDV